MNIYKAMLNTIVEPLYDQDASFLKRRIEELKQSVFEENRAISEMLERVLRYINMTIALAEEVENGNS